MQLPHGIAIAPLAQRNVEQPHAVIGAEVCAQRAPGECVLFETTERLDADQARRLMMEAGVPVLPGSEGAIEDEARA